MKRLFQIVRIIRALNFLDERCASFKLGTGSGGFIGAWNCDGDFLATVEKARKRIENNE